MPKIWEASALPCLEELRPPADLLAWGADVPRRYMREMQRLPGQLSYCKALGVACGGPGSKSDEAWSEFASLGTAVHVEIAGSFATAECVALPEAQQAGAKRFVQLLLTQRGIELLRSVAEELHSLGTHACWAWYA